MSDEQIEQVFDLVVDRTPGQDPQVKAVVIWQPIAALRWKAGILQQGFYCPQTGKSEWRDVPTEE